MQYSQGISYIRSGKSSMWDLTCSSLFFHQFQAEPLCMQQAVPDSLICYQGFTVWAANFLLPCWQLHLIFQHWWRAEVQNLQTQYQILCQHWVIFPSQYLYSWWHQSKFGFSSVAVSLSLGSSFKTKMTLLGSLVCEFELLGSCHEECAIVMLILKRKGHLEKVGSVIFFSKKE